MALGPCMWQPVRLRGTLDNPSPPPCYSQGQRFGSEVQLPSLVFAVYGTVAGRGCLCLCPTVGWSVSWLVAASPLFPGRCSSPTKPTRVYGVVCGGVFLYISKQDVSD